MAVVLIEGFDHLASNSATLKGWNSDGGLQMTGRFGGFSLESRNSATFAHGLPSTYSTLHFGAALYITGGYTAGTTNVMAFINGATVNGSVRVSTSGANRVWSLHNAAGTQVAIGTIPILNWVWYYLELKIVVSATVGTLELRLNGLPTAECSATGLNTGSVNVDNIGFGWVNGWGIRMDDIYVTDTTGPAPNDGFLGDIRVDYLVPTAAGSKTNFTPSAAANWQTVDETTPSDADYNSSYVPGAMDLFTMADLSGNGVIYAVQTNLRAAKSDAGFRTVKPVFYEASGSGDTTRFYPGRRSDALISTYKFSPQLYDTSPDTATAWTVVEVNALQFGYMVGEASMFTLDARLV